MTAKRKKKRLRPRGGASMICTCREKSPTRVLRTKRSDITVVRERCCPRCGNKFSTVERRV